MDYKHISWVVVAVVVVGLVNELCCDDIGDNESPIHFRSQNIKHKNKSESKNKREFGLFLNKKN